MTGKYRDDLQDDGEYAAQEATCPASSAKSGKSASQFWWATIAGADCEPVEVATLDGERVAYTCGCGDPFYLDRPDCPCVLVPDYSGEPMERPLTPKQEAAQLRRERRAMAMAKQHSWRGPR